MLDNRQVNGWRPGFASAVHVSIISPSVFNSLHPSAILRMHSPVRRQTAVSVTFACMAMAMSGCMIAGLDYETPEIDTPDAWTGKPGT